MGSDETASPPRTSDRTSDERLAEITVGERTQLNGTIYLAAYDPAWPSAFESLARRIRSALGDKVRLLEHVGSTSVPGLCAKPIIDVVMAVASSADEPSYVPALESCGSSLRIRESDWFEHRLVHFQNPAANVHVFSSGCTEIDRMLAFRDWLRAHDDERELYAATKRELAAQTWKYTQNYADAKSDVVRGIMERALAARG